MTSTPLPSIHVSRLSKVYGADVKVFTNFDLNVQPGETCAILGPSGCGKSSLLKVIAGLEEFSEGEVTLTGTSPLEALQRGTLALLSSESSLLPWRNVLDNVKLPLDLMRLTVPGASEKSRVLLKRLHISKLEKNFPHQLSDGQRQRVRLAQALITDPKIVLLDEPFSSLDEGLRRVLLADLVEYMLNDEMRASILVTHYAFEAAAVADRVLIFDGPPMQKLHEQRIEVRASNRSFVFIEEKAREISAVLMRIAAKHLQDA